MKNIIFLDIDGVILPVGAYKHLFVDDIIRSPYKYDVKLAKITKKYSRVANLKKLALDYDAKFVLISTWRNLFPDEFLVRYLTLIGLDTQDYFHEDWVARKKNKMNIHYPKNQDIQYWLWEHEFTGDWWIIDDEDQHVPEENWIRTNSLKGYVIEPEDDGQG